MFRLIQAHLASAGKLHLRDRAPSLFLNRRTLDPLLYERSHLCFQIVAHEVKFMCAVIARWMDCGLSRRQCEDKPAMTGIDVFKAEDIAEEGAVRLRIFAIENDVSS